MQPIYVINGVHHPQRPLQPPLPQQVNNIQRADAVHSPLQSVHIMQPVPMVVMPPQYRYPSYGYQQYQSQIPQNTLIFVQATEQNGVDSNLIHRSSSYHHAAPNPYPIRSFHSSAALPPLRYTCNPPQHSLNLTKNDSVNIRHAMNTSSSSVRFNANTTHRAVHPQHEIMSLSELKQKLKQISCDVTHVTHHGNTNRNTASPNKESTGEKPGSIPSRASPSTNSTVSNNTDYSNINIPNSSNSASSHSASSISKSGNTRIYECLYCNHQFKQSHSLKDHIRTHTGEKPFQCEYCSRRFKVKYNMIVHTRIHTGVKPYVCKVCAKRYASKSGLNAHFKKHHPTQWKKSKRNGTK